MIVGIEINMTIRSVFIDRCGAQIYVCMCIVKRLKLFGCVVVDLESESNIRIQRK